MSLLYYTEVLIVAWVVSEINSNATNLNQVEQYGYGFFVGWEVAVPGDGLQASSCSCGARRLPTCGFISSAVVGNILADRAFVFAMGDFYSCLIHV